jgi:hypothetical protein
MKFPNGNKIHQDVESSFGNNAALLEEKLKSVDWRFFTLFYTGCFFAFTLSLFILIVVVKFALTIV